MSSAQDTPTKKSGFDSFNSVLVGIGRGVGGVVNVLYQAGRDTIETVIRNILPFMAFISVIIGIVTYTGFGEWLAHLWSRWPAAFPASLPSQCSAPSRSFHRCSVLVP